MIFRVDPSEPASAQEWPVTPKHRGVRNVNQDLADKLFAESLNNPQSPYFGKFVGLANGQVVVITEDLDKLAQGLREAEPDSTKTFWFEGGRDYDVVHEIWGVW